MAFGVGNQFVLKEGRPGEIVAIFVNLDCREYRVRVGKDTFARRQLHLCMLIINSPVLILDQAL
ncbi:MAG: hypothetical protein ACP5VS_06575 [Desulfomonilaceae bacterium]